MVTHSALQAHKLAPHQGAAGSTESLARTWAREPDVANPPFAQAGRCARCGEAPSSPPALIVVFLTPMIEETLWLERGECSGRKAASIRRATRKPAELATVKIWCRLHQWRSALQRGAGQIQAHKSEQAAQTHASGPSRPRVAHATQRNGRRRFDSAMCLTAKVAQRGGLRPLILDMSCFHEPSRWGMYGSSSFMDSWPDMDIDWLR